MKCFFCNQDLVWIEHDYNKQIFRCTHHPIKVLYYVFDETVHHCDPKTEGSRLTTVQLILNKFLIYMYYFSNGYKWCSVCEREFTKYSNAGVGKIVCYLHCMPFSPENAEEKLKKYLVFT
jgi:hypothetical protein